MRESWTARRKALVAVLVVIVLLIGGGVAFSVLNHSSGSTPAASSAAPRPLSMVVDPSPVTDLVVDNAVTAVAFSSDRKTFADRLADGTVQLRDPSTGALLATLKTAQTVKYETQDTTLAFSPDGKTLAVGVSDDEAGTGTTTSVELWNVAARHLTIAVPVTGAQIDSLAYSPDGSTIAVAVGQSFALVDTKSLSPVYISADVKGGDGSAFQGNAQYVAYSADGKTLIVADNEGLVQVWDVAASRFTKHAVMPLPAAATAQPGSTPETLMGAVAVNRDGSAIVGGGDYSQYDPSGGQNTQYASMWIWNPKAATGKSTAYAPSSEAEGAEYTQVAFSPANDLFAAADSGGGWQLWNAATGAIVETRASQATDLINGLAFSPDGRTLALVQSSSEGKASIIELWDVYSRTDSPATCARTASRTDDPVIAYATQTTVQMRCGDGSPTSLGTVLSETDMPSSLAWSSDGTQLAWLSQYRVNVADIDSGEVRTWTCNLCTGLEFLGNRAVTVSQADAGGEASAAVPRLLEYPASGFAAPTALAVTGIPTVGMGTDFMLMATISPSAVVVAYGNAGGSDLGGSHLLYRVDTTGKATEYGHNKLSSLGNGPTEIFGGLKLGTAAPSGSTLTFNEISRGGACGGSSAALVLDTATGAISTPSVPSGGGSEGYWVEGLWFDAENTAYASLVPNNSTCSGSGDAATGSLIPDGKPIVCKLVDGHWTTVGTGVFAASYGAGGWMAQQTGTISQSSEMVAATTVSHGATTYKLPSGVGAFAWQPTH